MTEQEVQLFLARLNEARAAAGTPAQGPAMTNEYTSFKAWCDEHGYEAKHDRWLVWQGARAAGVLSTDGGKQE